MSLLRAASIRLLTAFWVCVASVAAASAACSDLATLTVPDLEKAQFDIDDVQQGLRSAYLDANRRLTDGRLGGYTRTRLVALCNDVPRPAGQDTVRSTLQLAEAYGALDETVENWARRLFDLVLLDADGEPAQDALGIRIAATLPMTTMVIGREAAIYDCSDPTGALADYPDGARALGTLTRVFRDKSTFEICQMMPVAGGVAEWQLALARLGQISSGTRTGALDVLNSAAFIRWIEADRENRLRRLAGTMPAVLALLDEYDRLGGGTPGATKYAGGPCTPVRLEETLTFYTLDQEDVDNFDFLVSLSPKLEAFKSDQPAFDNPQALWRALEPVLADDLDSCILAEIEQLVKGPDQLALTFLMRPAAVDALMVRPGLETALPVLTELAPLRTATKAEFIDRIKAGLEAVQQELVDAEVTAAADTVAAASEPAGPITDTALIELDDTLDGDAEPVPLITVTDATDQAVESAIDNPELTETLRNTPMLDATVPELLRAQVRTALEDAAALQAQRAVERQITQIEPAVTSQWTLTEPLIAEILAIPFVEATIADATADGVQTRLTPLVGVSYPSFRLFNEALSTVSNETGKVPFSTFVQERIVDTAQTRVPNPQVPRAMAPLQIDDCQCAPERLTEDLTVYGFYPFWLAPTRADALEAAAIAAGTLEPDNTPPQEQTLINFGTFDHIAFYGLEFRKDAAGQIILKNRDRWREARQTFVNSAHQYRARADLAFDLRDWMDWSDGDIAEVVEDISDEMGRFDWLRGYELSHFAEAIPTLFERRQPDGVTLIFHDYQGFDLGTEEMKTMVRIIKRVYEALPNRDRLAINVAFDFPLVQERREGNDILFDPILNTPIFDELFELLQERPYVLADEDQTAAEFDPTRLDRETAKIVDKVLLFLERPTRDAKKGLRFRMEQGLFQGELRRKVLRSIVPVLPPAGHREVRTTIKSNDPDQTPRPDFSQLEDDVVYFKDNFAGIGFWPVPAPVSSAAAQADPQLAAETENINALVSKHFNAAVLPPVLASFSGPVERVCTFACPNRAAIGLAAMTLFVGLVLLTWRSFYSGWVDHIAFRFMTFGLVWIGNLVLLGTLFVLANCDPHSITANILMGLLIAVLGLLIFYNFIQRIKNGTPP